MDKVIYTILLILFFAETGMVIELIQNEYLETYYTLITYKSYF